MKRMLLFLLCATLAAIIASPAQAKFKTRVIPQDKIPHRFVDKVRSMTTKQHPMYGVLDSLIFVTMKNNGDTRFFTEDALRTAWSFSEADACDYRIYFVGAATPRRFHNTTPRMTDLNNASLGYARAGALCDTLGNPGRTISQAVRDCWKPGVFIARVYLPPTKTTESTKDTVVIVHETKTERIEVVQEQRSDTFAIGPTIGVVYVNVDGNDFLSPSIGGVVRHDNVVLFMSDGRTFEETRREEGRDDRLRYGGIRFGQPTGLYWGFTYLDARRLMVEYDQYTYRAVGGTVTGGYQRSGAHLYGNLGVGVGMFNLVTPAKIDADWKPGFAAMASVGLTF